MLTSVSTRERLFQQQPCSSRLTTALRCLSNAWQQTTGDLSFRMVTLCYFYFLFIIIIIICLVPGLQRTKSAWQYKSQYNINSKLTAGSLQITLDSNSTCYCSKRLRKRVRNGKSGDTERSLPELSPGSGYTYVLESSKFAECLFINFFFWIWTTTCLQLRCIRMHLYAVVKWYHLLLKRCVK